MKPRWTVAALALGFVSFPFACGGGGGDKGDSAGRAGTAGTAARGSGGKSGSGGATAAAGGDLGMSLGGASSEAAAERAAHCRSICAKKGYPFDGEAGAGGAPVGMSCGHELSCAAYFCDTTGFDETCVDNLDSLLACVDAADPRDIICGDTFVAIDLAAYYNCPELLSTWATCRHSQSG